MPGGSSRSFPLPASSTRPPCSSWKAIVDPKPPGSRLDADHPENGVLIPCRLTVRTSRRASAGASPLYVKVIEGQRPVFGRYVAEIGLDEIFRVDAVTLPLSQD